MSLPILRGSSQALYPFTQTISYLTGVKRFQNGAQQRFARRPLPLITTEIEYHQLTQSQKNTLKTAFIAAKGQQSTSLSITIGSVEYDNLSFNADVFDALEAQPTQYSSTIRLIQSAGQNGLTASSTPETFPTFSYSTITQLPFTESQTFKTTAGMSPVSGNRFTYAWNTSTARSIDYAGLRRLTLTFDPCWDADLSTLLQHFVGNQGALGKFSFTNPDDSSTYTSVHYASDDLVIRYNAPNNSSVTVVFEETNN